MHLEDLYFRAVATPGNINEHCPTLRRLSAASESVIEFGVENAVSTTALLAGQPGRLTSHDKNPSTEAESLRQFAGRTQFDFRVGSSLDVEPAECDLLFIDTLHTGEHLLAELARHSPLCRRWIALHDITTFGWCGEHGESGLIHGLLEFFRQDSGWRVAETRTNNNGLLVLERR